METVTLENASPPFFAGIDVGGTSIKVGIVDDEGKTVGYTSFPTEAELGAEIAVLQIRDTLDALISASALTWNEIAYLGLGTPGTMDIPDGLILEPPNLPGWRHFPIRDELSRATGKPVSFANDANAAAYGEYWIGSGRKHNSIVMLTLGTGVGGGIVLEGKTLDGESSHGGECGHVMIDSSPDARICSCGQRGHLEAYASATALIARCEEALMAGETSSLANHLAKGEKINGLLISRAGEQGDQLALRLIMETADYLAQGSAIFMNTIDPSALILGGAMNFGGESSPIGRKFIERVRETAGRLALPIVARNVKIEFAQLRGDAGYIGAAGLAREAFYRSNKPLLAQ